MQWVHGEHEHTCDLVRDLVCLFVARNACPHGGVLARPLHSDEGMVGTLRANSWSELAAVEEVSVAATVTSAIARRRS